MKLTIETRGARPSKRFPLEINLSSPSSTVAELKQSIESKSNLSFSRQRITTVDKKVLDDDEKSLQSLGLKDGDKLQIKDLGPQICASDGTMTRLFVSQGKFTDRIILSTAGPLFIHPIFYFGSKLIYRREFNHSKMQKVALVLILAHYAKRELETIFVHRFSSATMPLLNLFKNCGHYWGLSGLLLAAPLYGPWNGSLALKGSIKDSDKWIQFCVALWLFGELSNLSTHITLRNLRPPGTKTRAIPYGYGFGSVSCPNYWFETIAWAAFTALTLNWAAAFFSVVAVVQMYVWAVKKHRRYKKEFGKDYPRGRKAMFPFIA